MLQARKTVWPFGLSRFRSVESLSLLLRHLDSSLDSISPARAIRDTSTAQNLRPVHFFLAVLAAARKSEAFGAPLLPGLRGLPPRLRLALMLAYRPGLPFGIVHTQGQCHFGKTTRPEPACSCHCPPSRGEPDSWPTRSNSRHHQSSALALGLYRL